MGTVVDMMVMVHWSKNDHETAARGPRSASASIAAGMLAAAGGRDALAGILPASYNSGPCC